MDIYSSIVRFFQSGGPFMYPIVLVLALGVAIAIERYIFLSFAGTRNRRVWGQLEPLLRKGDLKGARSLTRDSSTAISKILDYGLERLHNTSNRSEVEMAMEESLMEEMPRLEKRTHYLATFANLATLLGLLGTIIGLIQAFTAVANASPAQKADLLSASISVAMNTTAFGLMVAIPLLLIHAVLQTKTTELEDSLEMVSVKFLNAVADTAQSGSSE